MREDRLHYLVRAALRERGWRLVAGQYPDGTDDLPPLNVVDPSLARDRSPDHRRHSMNKLVPDLVACIDGQLLLVEMKDAYDPSDEAKLILLLTSRRDDLIAALARLEAARPGSLCAEPHAFALIPCLGLPADGTFPVRPDFAYVIADNDDVVTYHSPGSLSATHWPFV